MQDENLISGKVTVGWNYKLLADILTIVFVKKHSFFEGDNVMEFEYKKSKYNYVFERDRDTYVIFNTFSKAIVILDNEEYQDYQERDAWSSDNLDLINNGILIKKDFEEIEFLKYMHYKTRFNTESLVITIAPTLACNFDCPYCFEQKRIGKMNRSVQDSIISYVEDKMKSGLKSIDITWYGGEPLLVPEVIDYTGKKILSLCKKYNVKYKILMITNGYLLSDDICKMLVESEILKLQITFDGLDYNHNKRRYLVNGGETFEKIYKNLYLAAQYGISVDIRMNIDSLNYMDFSQLKKKINDIPDLDARVYPAIVENICERVAERNDLYMQTSDYEQFIIDGKKNGIIDDGICEIVDNRCYFCSAVLENTIVIDELGNVYKCWDEIGKEDSICFNICDSNIENFEAILKYMGEDPFSRNECKECKFLPLCFGGCSFQRQELTHSVCAYSKERINSYLESKIRQ